MSSGELREKMAFDKRSSVSDGYGNTEGAWTEQFTRNARIRPRLGGETVTQERLAGRQPVLIIVRYDRDTKLINESWRARDTRSGLHYNIRSQVNPDEKKKYVEMFAEAVVVI